MEDISAGKKDDNFFLTRMTEIAVYNSFQVLQKSRYFKDLVNMKIR